MRSGRLRRRSYRGGELATGFSGALLGDASYFGTLAAVRNLGRNGLPVAVADSGARNLIAQASRYFAQRFRAPGIHDASFVRWLLDAGAASPCTFLYPTSDEMVWVMSVHRDELNQHFRMFQPSQDAVLALLDKSRLYAMARMLGIAIPATHAPVDLDGFRALGATLQRGGGFPVMVKPRTQACMSNQIKGAVAHDADELLRTVQSMSRNAASYSREMADALPDLQWPLVQAFVPDAQHDTYSLSGFIDRDGQVRAVRASVKVFQLPVRAGIGVAFEGRPVRPDLLASVQRLALESGYFGVFEVEFLHDKATDQYLLTDFNPRFYGQMQFEIARGMELPRMVYAAAHGDEAQVSSLCESAERAARMHDAADERYSNRWLFGVLLRTQRWGGRLTAVDYDRWTRWMNEGVIFDAISDADDPEPQRVKRRFLRRSWLRHPRASYRDLFL